MSSLFGIGANGASDFYTTKINQSLRFEDGDSPRLSKTFGSGGSRTTFTFCAWVKRANISSDQLFFHSFGQTGFGIEGFIGFTTQNKISFQFDYNSGNPRRLVTNRDFRDITSWYHICCVADSTNSTSGDRLRMYINGVRETDFFDADYPSSSQVGTLNQAFSHYVSGRTNNSSFFDGYLAEVNFLDGVAVTDTNGVLDEFISIKNGICVPKPISGLSYGTTGFRFTFADSSSLGDDTSGNTNDFSSSGVASTDVVIDVPNNNFPILNGLDKKSGITLTEGNLKRVDTSDGWESLTAPFGMRSGKYYAEFVVTVNGSGSFRNFMVGVVKSEFNGNISDSRFWTSFDGHSYHAQDGNKVINGSGSGASYGDTWDVDDVIGVALNLDDGELTFFKNNVSQGVANTGLSGEYVFVCATFHNGTHMRVNFGADNTFAGDISSSGNSDVNGSVFRYTPPSGFVGLNSTSLPDTTLSPNQSEQADDYFNTKLYTGTGSDNNAITGVGFQPDWSWLKERTSNTGGGNFHFWHDSSRGASKVLQSNTNGTESDVGSVFSFDADGFTVGGAGGGTGNQNGENFVAWNWKINGGTTTTDNNGSVTSTIQSNPEIGISIALFNVASQGNFSFGHGLGSVPEMFWWKARNGTQNWIVYHFKKTTSVPSQSGIYLNSTLAGFTTGGNWITEVSSTRVAITDGQVSSGSNRDNIVYSFKSIDGFSRIGGYTGNNSTDGTFIYTGFRPAWVMIKATAQTESWGIHDNTRNTFNVVDKNLLANAENAENAVGTARQQLDFLSNGFKLRNAGDSNSSINNESTTYIYIAFAEQPFKFSNAR